MTRGASVSIRTRRVAAATALFVFIAMTCVVALAQDDKSAGPAQPEAKPAQQQPELTPKILNPSSQTIPEPTVQLKPGEVPAIKFDTPAFSFGRVMAGKPIECVYYFTNTGNGPLEILKVRPGCSCTVTGEYSKIVQPGDTGKIPIKMDTSKLAGRKTSKTIAVYTNIPGPDKEVRLTLVGDIWQGIECTPNVASFGSLTIQEAEQKPTTKVTIINNMEEPAHFENIVSTHAAFKPEIRVLEPGRRFEMTITLESAKETGGITAAIEFDTGVAAMPKFSLPVRTRINPPLTVVPGRIEYARGSANAALNRMVTISNNTTDPVMISDLKCSNEAIKVTLRELRVNKLFRIQVSMPEGYEPGAAGDTITFKTTCPSAPEVTIPITGPQDAATPNGGAETARMKRAG